MAIDWQSLLKRYMALNYVPLDGGEAAREFSAEELAALRAIEAEYYAPSHDGAEYDLTAMKGQTNGQG